MRYSRFKILPSVLALVGLNLSDAFAKDPSLATNASVVVQVRAVKALDQVGTLTPGARQDGEMFIDDRLKDLQSKFRRLHYRKFQLISSQKETVPMTKKQTFILGNGQNLTVRPLYCDKKSVGMWLRWNDAAGGSVLDTRMHFNPGETMITGFDGNENSGTLLAIDVSREDSSLPLGVKAQPVSAGSN